MKLLQNTKLLLLSLGHLVTDLNQGAIALVAVLLKDKFELSYFMVGMIILVSNVTSSLVQPIFGAVSDRRNTLWMMPLGMFAASVGLALSGIAPTFELALLCILVSGLGVAAFHPDGSKAARLVSGEKKASGMSIFSVGGNLGFGLGPIFAAFVFKLHGLAGLFWFIVPCVFVAIITWRMLPAYRAEVATKPVDAYSVSEAEVAAKQPEDPVTGPLSTLIGIIAFRSWAQLGVVTFIPLYIVDVLDLSKDYSAYLISLFLIAGALGTILGGPLSDKFGARRLMFISMLLTAPLLYLIPLVHGLTLEIVLFLAGAIMVSTFSPTIVLGQQMAPNHVGLVSGLMIGFAMGAGGLGASLMGKAADYFGIVPILESLAILPIICAGLTLVLVYGWRSVKAEAAKA